MNNKEVLMYLEEANGSLEQIQDDLFDEFLENDIQNAIDNINDAINKIKAYLKMDDVKNKVCEDET